MRKITLALCGWLALAAIAVAADFAALKPQGYVSDYAGVVDPAAKAALEQYCALVEAKTGAQIAVLTVPSLEGEPVEDVANDVFRKWGVGKKGTNEGVLLLLATQDKRWRLEVGYGLEPILPDGFVGSVGRQMSPFLKESRYGDAITEAVQTIGTRIADAKNMTLDGSLPRAARPSSRSTPFPLIVFGVMVLLWLMGAMRGGRGGGSGVSGLLMGMLLGNMLGRSSGLGRGGGGFGGFDSGGGFGGFGGGDSGGGGASGSW